MLYDISTTVFSLVSQYCITAVALEECSYNVVYFITTFLSFSENFLIQPHQLPLANLVKDRRVSFGP